MQCVRFIFGQLLNAGVQQRCELGGDGGAPTQLPDTAHLPQRAGFQRTLDQVPDIQGVASGGRPHQVRRKSLQPAAERFFDQAQALRLGERRQPQPLQVTVFP